MAVGTQRMTTTQFEEFATRPEHTNRRFELIAGEVHEVVSDQVASHIASRISGFLFVYLERHPTGFLTSSDGGFKIGDERYIPDVAYISEARQSHPANQSYGSNPPDLAVEVISPTDQQHEIRIKLVNYLAAGVRVWIVRPDTRMVEGYVPGQPPRIIDEDGTISGGETLPGFELHVRDIFSRLERS